MLAWARLPAPRRRGRAEEAAGLAALAGRYDGFILDGYGGRQRRGGAVVPGIVEAVHALQAAGTAVMVLTNGAGRPVHRTARRYAEWGLGIPERLVVSSRDSLEADLAARAMSGLWGVMAKPDSEIETLPVAAALLGDDDSLHREADGFILLNSGEWTVAQHRRLAAALRDRPRPVLVANSDVSAPRTRTESAPPSRAIGGCAWRRTRGCGARGFGKPFPHAFDLALARLGAAGLRRERIAMVGDGLYTDVLGGLASGLGTVLMTAHGLMRSLDWREWVRRTGISPDYVVPGP